MREILFRAKRFGGSAWVYGDLVRNPIHGMTMHIADGKRRAKVILTLIVTETICQYTGLTDRTEWEELSEDERERFLSGWNYEKNRRNSEGDWNGRKIFEGDIVMYTGSNSMENGHAEYRAGKVVWDAEKGCFDVTERQHAESWEVLQDCSVIGDIFDSPGLLLEMAERVAGSGKG